MGLPDKAGRPESATNISPMPMATANKFFARMEDSSRMPVEFGAIDQNVIWPFEADCRRHQQARLRGKDRIKCIGKRQARDETKRRCRLHL